MPPFFNFSDGNRKSQYSEQMMYNKFMQEAIRQELQKLIWI